MARFDKYDPISGGFRAALNADYTGSANPVGVGVNTSGRVVVGVGAAAIGICGVICQPKNRKAGEVIDVMTSGEIVEFAGSAGVAYTANTTTGAITNGAASATQQAVGFTVEASRLIVRCAPLGFI
jgi:hypothetical protein